MRELNKRLRELLKNSFEDINSKDENGNTILHLAAQFSSDKTVKLLIEKGANINIENNEGEVPLHRAALARKVRNVRALIEAEADVHCTNYNGSTPLHLASGSVWLFREKGGNAKGTVKELVKAGANINAINRLNDSPLCYARNKAKIANLLQKKGAKIIDKTRKVDNEIEDKEIKDVLSRLFLPDLEGKIFSLDEIQKRDELLIVIDLLKLCEKKEDPMTDITSLENGLDEEKD